jgi:flagellum-specific peptidoglycan hydrolase FlgJ
MDHILVILVGISFAFFLIAPIYLHSELRTQLSESKKELEKLKDEAWERYQAIVDNYRENLVSEKQHQEKELEAHKTQIQQNMNQWCDTYLRSIFEVRHQKLIEKEVHKIRLALTNDQSFLDSLKDRLKK